MKFSAVAALLATVTVLAVFVNATPVAMEVKDTIDDKVGTLGCCHRYGCGPKGDRCCYFGGC
ncbi:hypothetical protein K7432_017882 [Basidiobolus ranarum]|uniref:Uncharacterized protein n=1 Tax=Basidiobolus ranarum TaxID=34480 RepID=A0ABR2WCU3_9FUNG